jgi:tellurite resistance protein TerC
MADNSDHYSILWMIFGIMIGIMLAIDFGLNDKIKSLVNRKHPRQSQEPFKHALIWTIIWISLATVFAGIIFLTVGHDKALLFVTGYIIEKSLSVDNMFVFLLIFSSLAIPHIYQHKVLTTGILSAIIMRIALILTGVSLLESFQFMTYMFGGLLLFTAIRMLIQMRKGEEKIEVEKNIAIRFMKKIVPISFQLNGDKFFIRKDGILYATSMMIALVIVEMTDLIFALDSIPAILAITSDSFIVITSNIFAILGLRSLYFLLAGMISKFYYLKHGLVAILLFVGVKMSLTGFFEFPIILSMITIIGILTLTLGLSFIKTRRILKKTI